MKTLSVTLSLVGVLIGLVSNAAATAKRFPVIESVSGKVEWIDKDGKSRPLTRGQVLMEKAHLKTLDKSEIVLALHENRQLRMLSNTELELPAIAWETGETPQVILQQGTLVWKEGAGNGKPTLLHSDLFEKPVPPGFFVWNFQPKTATASVLVIEGSVEFSALNADEVALATAGQKIEFQGVIESNEIVYDILLQGRRIPRGKLGLVQPLSAADKKQFSPPSAAKKAADLRRQQEAEKAKMPVRVPGDICDKPFGKLNQCAWSCDGNPAKAKDCEISNPQVHCTRRRCNANGDWAEAAQASGCGLKPEVRACDY